MNNLHESMGLGRNQTGDPWICSQTCICSQTQYRLRYVARSWPEVLKLFMLNSHKQEIENLHKYKNSNKCTGNKLGGTRSNSRPRGRNFTLNGTQGEGGVSLKKKKKHFFLGGLIFILSLHKCNLW